MNAERTAEEWGRVAVSLPGWRWMLGMLLLCRGAGRVDSDDLSDDPLYALDFRDAWPDLDDPATAGCLLSLLTSTTTSPSVHMGIGGARVEVWEDIGEEHPDEAAIGNGPTLGRACIAAAEALGRWPGS